ncbi:MAG: ABC transporter ATP-binding protein [Chloroflexi bacterium]|nr:ABC transporter ATP-binding protein [Chloroflexota bacterium]
MLAVERLHVRYGDVQALFAVSLDVFMGEILSVVGANGAGKTTLLNAISGLLPVSGGEIVFDGQPVHRLPPHDRVARGIVQVPEGRKLFSNLTVLENLEMGSYAPGARSRRRESLARVFELFPRLAERRGQLAATLSGGEQQMLAIGRALMALPRLLLLDEPSLGLAPVVVQQLFDVIRRISSDGVTILLVEQNVRQALSMANRGYVIENGHIVGSGTGPELLADDATRRAFLGV